MNLSALRHPRAFWIAVCLLLVAVVAGPFLFRWKIHDQTHVFKLGEYGNWLAGALTPGVIIIALFALLTQMKSQKDAIQAQTKATKVQVDTNRKLLMGIMLDNIDRLQGHLNYLAYASSSGEYRRASEMEAKTRMYYIARLLEPDNQPIPGEQTEHLKKGLRTVVNLARESETDTYLDRRILALDEKLNGPQQA